MLGWRSAELQAATKWPGHSPHARAHTHTHTHTQQAHFQGMALSLWHEGMYLRMQVSMHVLLQVSIAAQATKEINSLGKKRAWVDRKSLES